MTGRRLAFLVASDDYIELPKLNGPTSDIKNLAKILKDGSIGRFEVSISINEKSGPVKDRLNNFTLGTVSDDIILFYFSGHGIMKPEFDAFYLSTIDTTINNPESDAISNVSLLKYINQSYSRTKIIILDCCHSASVTCGMKNSNLTGLFSAGRDLFLLTATNEIGEAIAEESGDKGKGSLFTSVLVHGLENGEADINNDGIITPTDIKLYMEQRVPDQNPKCWLFSCGKEEPMCWIPRIAKKYLDPILGARIDNLLHNLTLIKNQSVPCKLINGRMNVKVGTNVWEGLQGAKRTQAFQQITQLKKIQRTLEGAEQLNDLDDKNKCISQCWDEFSDVYESSKKFFDEYLELIGGLFLRDIGEQERIYRFADELLKNCIEDSVGICVTSRSIPALPETLIKTFARIIGLKFPEWTIWTLPYVAHELGHILIKHNLLSQENNTFLSNYEDLPREFLHDFVADAFATIITGSSYVCAWFILGFNPKIELHIKRAYVIFKILELMNAYPERPYSNLCKVMGAYSDLLVEGSFKIGKLRHDIDLGRIDDLIGDIWNSFSQEIGSSFLPQIHYPINDPNKGWVIANKLYLDWINDLKKQHSISYCDDPSNTIMVRDVLNAAWFCRLEKPEFEAEIAVAAQELCDSIVEVVFSSKGDATYEGALFAEKEPKKTFPLI